MNKAAMIYNESNLETQKYIKPIKLCATTKQALLNLIQYSTTPSNSFHSYQNQISNIL